jgi:hypothetical protein
MQYPVLKSFALLCSAFCLSALYSSAHADTTPGSLVTLGNSGKDHRNLFTVTGNTITINGDVSGNSEWFLNGLDGNVGNIKNRLIGISELYLVDINSNFKPKPGPDVSIAADAGYVKTNASALFSSRVDWTNDTFKSYSRFTDGGIGDGFAIKSPWLTVGDPSLVGEGDTFNAKGKLKKQGAVTNEFGSFTFDVASLLDKNGKLKYDIGIDYLVQPDPSDPTNPAGVAGHAYFALSTKFAPSAPVPELSTLLGFGSLIALGGLSAFRQRKQATKAA